MAGADRAIRAATVPVKPPGHPPVEKEVSYESIRPLLKNYCFGCHNEAKKKGDLSLEHLAGESDAVKNQKVWEKVLKNIQSGEMPPDNKPQPSLEEKEKVFRWIETKVFQCDCSKPDPGRVTIRRLNRSEYNNTIRDLIGIHFQPAEDFPADDSGYGFDNIGDVLSLPPVLLEKYLMAAERIVNAAIPEKRPSQLKKFNVDSVEVGFNSRRQGNGWVSLSSTEEDDVSLPYIFASEGEFIFSVRAYAHQETNLPMVLTMRMDNKELKQFQVTTNELEPEFYSVRIKVAPGKTMLTARVQRERAGDRSSATQKGTVFVESVQLEGPIDSGTNQITESRKLLFTCGPEHKHNARCATKILQKFATRAYRRPVTDEELKRLTALVNLGQRDGQSVEASLKLGLQAVLVSPHFLFRGELQPEPDNPKSVHPINEYALASRLSYFLWSSTPDDELFKQSRNGTLKKNIESQVRRMLKDPKSQAFVENFAGQWLQIRNLKLMAPDVTAFPNFDEALRNAMQEETFQFFGHLLRADRSITEFLDSDYSFINERLAKHYGIDGVKGPEFRKVAMSGGGRGGILTHGSVLTLTSNPTRTSPVKRGKWVLENILGTPPPPPPPEVPELKDEKGKELTGTLRQRMEQHRENPSCSSCHARMDPIGFGMENFDGIGAFRKQDGKFDIDSSGTLVTGESFKGATELKKILVESKKNEFVRCFTSKLLTYALGRGLEYQDKCAVDEIMATSKLDGYRFSSVIVSLVKSVPFQKRRGETDSILTADGAK